jgi:hypothetical protein
MEGKAAGAYIILSLGWLVLLCLEAARAQRPAAPGEGPESDERLHAARCPAWAKEKLPESVLPFVGKLALPAPYPQRGGPLGKAVAGIDRWQANRFIVYRPETADFLYRAYTPLKVGYRPGSLPAYEKVVARYAGGLDTDKAKAVALLTRAMVRELRHPTMPPLGRPCRADRALADEELLKSGTGFCNEQARVFTRLCHVAGIPARIVHLFYADKRTGHTICEFHADGRWSMADSSWFCVFPAADGHLMSAAECHQEGPRRKCVGEAYFARVQEVLRMTDDDLAGMRFADVSDPSQRRTKVAAAAASIRAKLRAKTARSLGEELWQFGLINNPLPR